MVVVGRLEVEGGGEIAGDRPPPAGDVLFAQVVAAPEPLLDELDERGVIEKLGAHPAPLAPGRDDDHRHANAKAVRSGGEVAVAGEHFVGRIDGGQPLRPRLRRRRRNHVIEQAVVLVEHQEQRRLAEERRVRGQRVEDLRDVPGAEVRRPVAVLREALGRHDPGDLRQAVVADVVLQLIEEAAGLQDVGAAQRPLVERAPGLRVLVLMKVEQRVVAVVADEGVVVGPAPEVRGVEPLTDVLIDLPGDAGRLQHLGVGRPVVAGLGVVEHRAAVLAVVADPARPHVVAVGIGRAEQRAVVGVADGEGVGQRVVERDVVAGQIGHGAGPLLGTQPSYLPPFQARCVVFQSWGRSSKNCSPRWGAVG